MGKILLILGVFMAALVGLIAVSNLYTKFWVKMLIHRKHEWMETVQDTGYPPPDWLISFRKKIAKLPDSAEGRAKADAIRVQAMTSCKRRLGKLIDYARYTTLVSDEAERNLVLTTLRATLQEWEDDDASIREGI